MKFYKDITFNHPVQQIDSLENDNFDDGAVAVKFSDGYNGKSIFKVGIDTVFVALEIKIPLNDYIISNIKLTNVWVCSIDEKKYGKLSVSQLRAIGGCLSPNIDKNGGPYHILQNYDEHFYFNFKHINLNEIKNENHGLQQNIIRFSFIPPKSKFKRDKLFIHTQVTLTLIDKKLHANTYYGFDQHQHSQNLPKQNQIRHFGASIHIKHEDNTIIDNVQIFGGQYSMDKLIILLIIGLVLLVVCLNICVLIIML